MSSTDSSTIITCPNCRAPIPAGDSTCPNCGADIQVMALAASPELLAQALAANAGRQPFAPEELVPRLGEHLVQRGRITPDQLHAALEQQLRLPEGAPRRLLGQTLVDMGILSADALQSVIAARLLELQTALLEANRTLEQRVAARTAEVKAAVQRLSEFNQLKANFVANISHELRTPLTHIKGYNVLLKDGALGPLSPDQRQALETTSKAIERLEQLINDLISYAAAARGELTLNRRPVGPERLLLQVIERSGDKARYRQVSLACEAAADVPPVSADEEKLTWILLQLVDNAIKFTPAGGCVTLGARVAGNTVVLTVSDTGIGIPAGRLDEVFEPFQQLDGSSTRRYGGTGLGLALVRRIVEAHGAQMQVTSREGQGSLFAFALPCVAPA